MLLTLKMRGKNTQIDKKSKKDDLIFIGLRSGNTVFLVTL